MTGLPLTDAADSPSAGSPSAAERASASNAAPSYRPDRLGGAAIILGVTSILVIVSLGLGSLVAIGLGIGSLVRARRRGRRGTVGIVAIGIGVLGVAEAVWVVVRIAATFTTVGSPA